MEPISHKIEIEEETESQRGEFCSNFLKFFVNQFKFVDHKTNVSKVMLNVDEISNGPVSIQITTPENSPENSKSSSPTVSKVLIKHDDPISVIPEASDSDEDESLVNVYNLRSCKSTITPDKIVEAIVHHEDEKIDENLIQEEMKFQTMEIGNYQEVEIESRRVSMSTFKPLEVKAENQKETFLLSQKTFKSETMQKTVEILEKSEENLLKRESNRSSKKSEEDNSSRRSVEIKESVIETSRNSFQSQRDFSVESKMNESGQKPMESDRISQKSLESRRSLQDIEEKPIEPTKKPEQADMERPHSPLWTYTLPAPPTFADSNKTITDQVTTIGTNKYYNDFTSTVDNETIMSDNTTIVSDADIKPVIRERKPLDDQFIIGQTNPLFQMKADDQMSKSSSGTDVITSDIEDGYQGDKMKSKMQENSTKSQEPKKMEEEAIVNDFVKTIKENFKLEVKNGFEQEAQVGYDTINEDILRKKNLDEENTKNLENIRRSNNKNFSKLIVRSDSFHSIGPLHYKYSQKGKGLGNPLRSTSFVSLINAQKAENRLIQSQSANLYSKNKSSSELSISDSPSLQSLSVIKSILNNSSRKNSLQDVVSTVTNELLDTQNLQRMKKESPPTSPKIDEEEKPKWKYQGPPKINLTTWSERPKIEVSIKSDNDYKFGGGSSTLPRGFKNQQTIQIRRIDDDIDKEITPKDPKEDHLPKVLKVEYKKNVAPPPVHLREISQNKSVVNIKPRPMSMDAAKLWSQTPMSSSNYQTAQTLSFNRLQTNHSKFVPVVHGFKLNEIDESNGEYPNFCIPF